MSFKNLDFPDCQTCGKSTPNANVGVKVGSAQIPCFSSPNLPCDSNAGKFYDVFQESFIVPLTGNSVQVSICDPSLWASCQWIGACYPNAGNLMAIFKIVSIDPNTNKITIFNGCKDGKQISDNPAPGTTIPQGSVFYPLPPPECETEACNKIRELIADGDCACQGVLDCIASSKTICLTSVEDLRENEEVHMFGGTKPTTEGDNFFKSCLRKLKKIYTSFAGTTICYPDAPSFDEQGDGNKYAILDNNGCIRKGPDFNASSCDDSQNVTDGILTTIKGCKSGDEAAIKPSDKNRVMISCADDSNNKFWKEAWSGLSFFPILNQTEYPVGGGPRKIDHILPADIPPIHCARKRYAEFYITLSGCAPTNQARSYTILVNGVACYHLYWSGECRSGGGQFMCPVDDADPTTFNFVISNNGALTGFLCNVRFMGYWA